jgi:hypothetical protein
MLGNSNAREVSDPSVVRLDETAIHQPDALPLVPFTEIFQMLDRHNWNISLLAGLRGFVFWPRGFVAECQSRSARRLFFVGADGGAGGVSGLAWSGRGGIGSRSGK